jgi:NitT/TauT family transport system permease protein
MADPGMRWRRLFWPLRILVVIAVFGLWELLTRTGVLNTFTVSSPSGVWDQLWIWIKNGELARSSETTLITLAMGYGLGLLVGVVIGVATGLSTTLRLYFEPFLVFFNAVPRLILIPFFVTWLGFGRTPKVVVVFLVIVFLIIINVQAGIREVESDVVENARMLGARRIALLREVYAPAVAIWVLTSARLAIGIAFQAAVVTEFFGSTQHGLGYLIQQGQELLNTNQIYAGVVATVAFAWILDLALGILDRRVSRWVPSATS